MLEKRTTRTGKAAGVLFLLMLTCVHGAILYVSQSGSATQPYDTWPKAATVIQDAVDAANDGDEIVVGDGEYDAGGKVTPGYALTNRVCITNNIILRSVNGPEHTLIVGSPSSGGGFGKDAVRCIYVDAVDAEIRGFTFTNGHVYLSLPDIHDHKGGGIFSEQIETVISNCFFTGNAARYGGGVCGGTLYNCRLWDNSTDSAGRGGGSYKSIIFDSSLVGNSALNGGGSYMASHRNCLLSNNTASASGGGTWGGFLADSFLINNSTDQHGGGAYQGELSNCVLVANSADISGGGALNSRIKRSIFRGNSAGNGGGYVGNANIVYDSLFVGNSASNQGGGVYNAQLKNCTVVYNHALIGGGAYSSAANSSIIWSNTADTDPNHSGCTFEYSCTVPVSSGTNIDDDPLFLVDAPSGDFHLQAMSPCINDGDSSDVESIDLAGNPRLVAGAVDMGAYENQSTVHTGYSPDHYVWTNSPAPAWPHTNWTTAAHVIQNAVNAAADGDTVWVTNGVHDVGATVTPGYSLTNRVCITKDIELRSVNGPGHTSILGAPSSSSSNGLGPDAIRCIYVDASNAVINGLVITRGFSQKRQSSSKTWQDDFSGGGVFALHYSTLITNCHLVENSAFDQGGGSYRGTLKNCSLTDNVAHEGGGGYDGILDTCEVHGNRADNGGGTSQGSLYNCDIYENSAELGGGSFQGTLEQCRLRSNTAGGDAGDGGGAFGGILNNCLLSGNSASSQGGGAMVSTMNNCTVVRNTAAEGGGTWSGTAFNSIVWSNSASSGSNFSWTYFSFSCSTPGLTGDNIEDNPQFVDAASADYRLDPQSPCINAGSNGYVSWSADLDGNTRIVAGAVDMGAYENQSPVHIGDSPIHYVVKDNAGALWPFTNWPTAAANIQDAIDVAVDGDRVLVSNGVYNTGGRVAVSYPTTNRVLIEKDIAIRSVNGPATTIIAGQGPSGPSAVRGVWISDGSLCGFTITNGHTQVGGGDLTKEAGGGCFALGGVLSNCVISGNSAHNSGGGVMEGTVYNSLIIGNTAGHAGGGANRSELYNCTVSGNTSPNGGGTCVGDMYNSIVWGNHDPSGTYSNYHPSYCDFIQSCTAPWAAGVAVADDPLFVNPEDGDYHLSSASPCINAGSNGYVSWSADLDGNTRIVAGAVDMGAYENQSPVHTGYSPDHYVWTNSPAPAWPHTNWTTAAHVIQNAVNAAADGDTVWVTNGVHDVGATVTPGHYLTNRVCITKDIEFRSVNGPVYTFIAGAPSPANGGPGPDAIRCIYVDAANAVINGFTLTQGYSELYGTDPIDRHGGGVSSVSTLTLITNCVLSGNVAVHGGGSYRGTLKNCTLTANQATYGGGAFEGVLDHCGIHGNWAAYGGGGTCIGTLNNCDIHHNIALSEAGGSLAGVLEDCTLRSNTAGDGGGAHSSTMYHCSLIENTATNDGGGAFAGTLNNCLVIENDAEGQGGGTKDATLNNCTVVRNTAAEGGGTYGGQVNNSIVWSNTASSGDNFAGSLFSFSCSTPAQGGDNIGDVPQFVDAASGDFHLEPVSPCINAGSNGYVSWSVDLDGLARIVNGSVDMGAYEYQGTTDALLDVSPGTLSFFALEGRNDPAIQVRHVSNTGSDDLNFTIETTYSQHANNWLSLSQYSGSLAPGQSDTSGVWVDIDGLSTGVYYATNTVISPEAANSPQVQTVILTIQPDCNGNNIADAIDIQNNTSTDCNGNGRPDECDIIEGGLLLCTNRVEAVAEPDECCAQLTLSPPSLSGSCISITYSNDYTGEVDVPVTACFPLGTTVVNYTVQIAGHSYENYYEECQTTVIVTDETAPAIQEKQ